MKHKIIPVDFETERIERRPVYPPKPVGVALKWEGRWRYMAWGHPTENNCTKRDAVKILMHIFKGCVPLMHNAAFDIYVGIKHLGLPFPKQGYHDTLFLAYLHDPRDASLSLKPLAEKYLNMPPEEQDDLREWILAHTDCKNTRDDPWGAHICEGPGGLVGKYAKGDVIRTERLFKYFYAYAKERGMLGAYERELQCMPVFEDMSIKGARVAVKPLQRDLKQWEALCVKKEAWIKRRIKAPKDLLIASSKQLAKALDAAGKVDEWILTKKGNKSASRENLLICCNDKKLTRELGLHGVHKTFINTFAKPWLATATQYGGRVYPSFNQVRSPDERGKKSYGTRTGRPSSNNPNFLNVPRDHGDDEVPWMRSYIIPDEGCVFAIRDYNQQEMRILAHYEEGSLYQAYLNDPTADAHELVRVIMNQITRQEWCRDDSKVMNFGTVYGMGLKGTQKKIKKPMDVVKALRRAYYEAMPDIKQLTKDVTAHSKAGNPIYTWGHREYYSEPSKLIDGEMRDFHYKQTNYLIQGSGADCTKEAMIRSTEALKIVGGRLVVQVYDELVACIPKGQEKRGMKLLKDAMESIEFDVPMLTDGKIGRRSWGQAVKYKD